MHREIITADDVGVAAEKMLGYLESTNEAHGIYFDGWAGLGASALLKAVNNRLTADKITPQQLKFEKIIHIDCSMWKSRREMQRKIAEELEIPGAKDIFDKQDEDDDFNGINERSRNEIKDVAKAISDLLTSQRFLAIFHNGSDDESSITDVAKFGLPLSVPFKGNKMLWTFRGRFRLSPKIQYKVRNADVFLSAQFQDQKHWWGILCEEAAQVAEYTCLRGIKLHPTIVVKCWLYISKLNSTGSHIIDYDWTVHASNYWICDGIIDGEKDMPAWDVAEILNQEMRQQCDDGPVLYYLMGNADNCMSARLLISDNYRFLQVPTVPQTVSSFFLVAQQLHREEQYVFRNLEYFGFLKLDRESLLHSYNDMFKHSENLRVLKLSRCTFRFASPPFLCCRSLRFLGLDHCHDLNMDGEEVQSWTCFQVLWVLDLYYTQWVLSQQMIDDMENMRELNVKGPNPCNLISHVRRWQRNICKLRLIKPTESHYEATTEATNSLAFSFSPMEKMELLDLSGNTTMQDFPDLSKATSLKTVIVDGCIELKHVSSGSLPASLEVFSLASEVAAKISRISLHGCSRLNKLFLRGLSNLEELDLSGTAVKTLDLNTMKASQLKRLLLLGCQWLRAILFLDDEKPYLNEVQIDTTTGVVNSNTDTLTFFQSHIHVRDVRLLGCLKLFTRRMHYLLLCISSTTTDSSEDERVNNDTDIGQYSYGSEQPRNLNRQPGRSAVANKEYNDVLNKVSAANVYSSEMWPCPHLPVPPKHEGSCKVKIMSCSELQESEKSLAPFVDIVDSLYMHDDTWRRRIPGSTWGWLKWCRIQRCSRLDSVFTLGDHGQLISFSWLESFWASHLKMARYIWSQGSNHVHVDSFRKLQYIHLDFCPRLIHVLPLSFNLPSLEMIQILYCSNLRQVFPLDTRQSEKKIVVTHAFPRLKRIHLHELPTLQYICEEIICAPMLETIKIKGCWGLKHLPTAVLASASGGRRPIVDCEKEWWDSLEWYPWRNAGHHPSLYQPRHSPYYKEALPKSPFSGKFEAAAAVLI